MMVFMFALVLLAFVFVHSSRAEWLDIGDNVQLFYKIQGEGYPLIFVHGYMGSEEDWWPVTSVLKKWYKCVAYDRRNEGKSSKPEKVHNTIEMNASDLNKLMTGLKIQKAVIIGHSMGGCTAMQFAVTYPERVAALVLVDSLPSGSMVKVSLEELKPHLVSMQGRYNIGYWLISEKFVKFSPYAQQFLDTFGYRNTINTEDVLVADALGFFKFEFVDRLKKIKAPTLVIAGDADLTCPVDPVQNTIAKNIPNARLEVIKGEVGHFSYTQKPEEFNEILYNFLQTVSETKLPEKPAKMTN
jgi:pimeloyl-ACP methyl ester carboxylesterase